MGEEAGGGDATGGDAGGAALTAFRCTLPTVLRATRVAFAFTAAVAFVFALVLRALLGAKPNSPSFALSEP